MLVAVRWNGKKFVSISQCLNFPWTVGGKEKLESFEYPFFRLRGLWFQKGNQTIEFLGDRMAVRYSIILVKTKCFDLMSFRCKPVLMVSSLLLFFCLYSICLYSLSWTVRIQVGSYQTRSFIEVITFTYGKSSSEKSTDAMWTPFYFQNSPWTCCLISCFTCYFRLL